MIKAEGHGQSECCQCKKEGKYSLTWTSFLYRTEKNNYKHLYCFEHCKKNRRRRYTKVKYGDKELQHCQVEKMGCPGCYYDEIEVNEYIRIHEEIAQITKKGKIDNHYIYSAIYGDGKEYTNISRKMITKHSEKISEVLKEGDVIFYTINNSPKIYMGKVRQYKLGLGSNYYSLEQLNIIKVITEKELKQVGYEVKEVQCGTV